ncbi:uncharacterized protein [Watersipora subatra]|uniref:uncharacterized protein n=1 Tax=Watersipora subatra TaxID=2589382 RepID=UPI00355AE481
MAAGRPPTPPIKFNGAYFCSWNFLIKLIQIVCLVITVVFSSFFTGIGSTVYIQIIGALGVCTCLAWIILFLCNLNARFPDFFPILMFVYHFLLALLTIGICVCCGVLWPQFKMTIYPQYAVATILSFTASILFLVDAMLNLLVWRSAVSEVITCPCSPWQYEIRM